MKTFSWKELLKRVMVVQSEQIVIALIPFIIAKFILHLGILDKYLAFEMAYLGICLYFTKNIQKSINEFFEKYKNNIKMLEFAYESMMCLRINVAITFIVAFASFLYVLYKMNMPIDFKIVLFIFLAIVTVIIISLFIQINQIIKDYVKCQQKK
jgi:hypothetical protein